MNASLFSVLRTGALAATLGCTSLMAHAESNQDKDRDKDTPPALTFSSLSGSITLNDGSAPVTELSLEVMNDHDVDIQSTLHFSNGEQVALSLAPGATENITLTPMTRHAGQAQGLQKAEIDLSLTLDDALIPVIANVDVGIRIPAAAFPLVRSEPPAMEQGKAFEIQYEYVAFAQQLQPLKFTYNPGPTNLQVRKTVYPIPVEAGPVKISIEVTNHGAEATQALTLRDTLEDVDFSASGDAFQRFIEEGGSADLIWETTIDQLAPGESRRLSYQVNARHAVGGKQLPATTVIMNDELTGLSNKVWLPKWH